MMTSTNHVGRFNFGFRIAARKRKPTLWVIVGTDTGVGKTMVTGLLAAALWQRLGRGAVAVAKPIESGCPILPDGNLHPSDGAWLTAMAGSDQGDLIVTPWRFAEPIAPGMAIYRLGATTPTLADVARHISAIGAIHPHRITLLEGAGGILAPLTAPGETLLDLLKRLKPHHQIHTLVVGRSSLGTINHTVLTLRALAAAGFPATTFILNQVRAERGADEDDNAVAIQALTKVSAEKTLSFFPPSSELAQSRCDFLAGPPSAGESSRQRYVVSAALRRVAADEAEKLWGPLLDRMVATGSP